MANRIKEEEKNEKIIRGLLKHPSNKRCINCNSLGPQYVCTNFWTFICTNCSGLHREFTHRVKSISMAKFTSQEVNALQEGGNERAREIFFKDWDPQRHSYPDSSHLDRLRDFIKHVYVERRYAGGKNIDGPPRVKSEQEDYDENRSSNTDRSGSRSPPYNDPYERRYGERPGSTGRNDDRNSNSSYEARSPSYDQGGYRIPSHFELRDEMHRDDKARNEVQSPKSSENRISDGLPKPGVSDHQKGAYISSPPMVRPVRDILGDNVPSLRVGEPPKMNGGKVPNIPLEKQSSTLSSKGPNDENSVELKRVNLGSLIDFSADPEPPVAGVAQEPFAQQKISTPANSGGWASFDVSSQQKAPEAASTSGDLETVFAQLSIQAPTTVVNSAISPAASIDSVSIANNGGQWPLVFPVASSQPTNPLVHTLVGSLNNPVPARPAAPSIPATVQGAVAVLDGQTSSSVMHLSNRPENFQNPLEAKNSGRKELPADLFTGFYPTSPVSYPGWRVGPRHGMVYNMQYPVMLQPVTTHKYPASMNPFDLANESVPVPNPMLHPSAYVQGVMPNTSNPLSLPNSSKVTGGPSQWAPQQFSYPSSALQGPYTMQQVPHDMPHQLPNSFFSTVNQGAGVASEANPYGVITSNQLQARTNSHLSSLNPSASSVGGNPFG
ncbi:probable ADP-ribosylation factor GTPase-activating protein AGD14 isoform X2 [Phalaenopsis equestris]|uniref:probable ADP-ribosylation factor GTPase-activating protein AGD14 isoform X2 n=1 Tax=Phalaenopsis equestris TaxID=78828 RepID=UPI0009E23542|nr:probable ADP-ribosylation factor GTPase-activating protein AGD14 isoform X2 [Phalaenopsis equestris]